MAGKVMRPTVGTGAGAAARHALPLAVIALLLASGPGSADPGKEELRASDVPLTVERLPEHAALEVTDFIDLMTSIGASDFADGLMVRGMKPTARKAKEALYQNTRLVNLAMDVIETFGPFLFEVQEVGQTWWGDDIRAVHVRVPMEWPARPDDAERPTLLVECNMHAREWLAMESCTRFLERLFAAYFYYPLETLYFMQHVNLYVVPVANPDGRNVDDDWFWVDPTTLWSNPIDCFSDTYWHANDAPGWRSNTQIVDCEAHPDLDENLGIDLARNFSRGWADASPDCMNNQFRGEYPFQASEAAALRRFVNNRTVSMSLHVHAFASSMRGRLDSSNAEVPSMRDGFIDWWNDTLILLPAMEYPVVELKADGPTGGWYGQFSAWVSDPSTVAGQLDHGTHRGINAFMLELPPDCANSSQCPNPYYGSAYDAGSNTFHPSAPAIIEDVVPAFIGAMTFLVKQAQYPWCAIDPVTFDPGSCSDIGLTGSKIAADTHEIGALGWLDTGTEAYETAPSDSYGAVYRIQNFDTSAPVTVDVLVEVASKSFASSSYAVDQTFTTTHNLAAGGSGVGEAADSLFFYTQGRDYRVTVTILNAGVVDTEPRNDQHLFKFRVLGPLRW